VRQLTWVGWVGCNQKESVEGTDGRTRSASSIGRGAISLACPRTRAWGASISDIDADGRVTIGSIRAIPVVFIQTDRLTLTNCRRKLWSCSVWDPDRKGSALSAAEKALRVRFFGGWASRLMDQ